MKIIIDIINNILKYNDLQNATIVIDVSNQLWFSFKDVVTILGYKGVKEAVKRLDVDDNYKSQFCLLNVSTYTGKIHPHTVFISEPGLYEILTKSKRPEAKPFQKELFENVLPSIRKTGEYKSKIKENKNIVKLNKKIKDLENKLEEVTEEKEYLSNKQKPHPDIKSTIYIKEMKIGSKKCLKIGFSDDNEERKEKHKSSTASRNIFEMDINLDGKQVENCAKNINKFHLIKKKADVMCYLELDSLVNSIKDCISLIGGHLGKCKHCEKEMSLEEYQKHHKLVNKKK